MGKPTELELHPGHWKLLNSGAVGLIKEVTEARRVTKRVYEILKSHKVPVTYFEDNVSHSQGQNLDTIVNHHNQDSNGIVVSIHFNGVAGTSKRPFGTEVLYYDKKDLAARLAKSISDSTNGGLLNRGAKQNRELAVLARTHEPAVLIEICFVNSEVDVAIYNRDFEKICQAIAKVLAAEIGYNISTPVKSPTGLSGGGTAGGGLNGGGVKPMSKQLNDTGRAEAKALIRRACKEGVFDGSYHTEERMKKYTDADLISYSIAYVNRTVKPEK